MSACFSLASVLVLIMTVCLLCNSACSRQPNGELSSDLATTDTLPEDIRYELDRFTFVNTTTGDALKEFRILGITRGAYEQGGTLFDTFVVSFEDRYSGADADLDFLDVIVEMKRARDSGSTTVRIVQLGLDAIDVYLDGEFLESVRPAIEIQITSQSE